MRPVSMVTIEEVPSGKWAIGGRSLTTQAVKAMAAGEKPGRAA